MLSPSLRFLVAIVLVRGPSLTNLAIILLVFYFSSVLALGVAAYRHSQPTLEDYFLANRGIKTWILVGTVVATMVNSLAVTGTPALFYEHGILFLQMFVALFGCIALMWVFGPRVCKIGLQKGIISQNQLFYEHYRSRAVFIITTAVGILSVLPFLAVQLAGLGKVLAAISSIPYDLGVILCATIIGTYIFFGGARAVIWTDMFQGLLALLFFTVSAVLFLYWAGGPASVTSQLSTMMPEKLVFNSSNTPIFVDNILSWSFAFFLWPHVFQRMFMSRNPQSIRQTAAISLIVINIMLIGILVMTMSATALLYGTLEDSDQLLATMFAQYLPIGGTILVIMIFALAMSTIDSMLLALSSSLSPRLESNSSGEMENQKSFFGRGRIITLAFLLIATVLAVTSIGRGAITPWVTLGASFATLLLWPFLGIFVWRRVTATSVIASVCLGFIAIMLARFTPVGSFLPFGFATAGFLVGGFTFFLTGINRVGNRADSPHSGSIC